MRYILTILFLWALSANGQDTSQYILMKADYKFGKAVFKNNLWIPFDTTNYKTGIARIGSVIYAGNGTKWTAQTGSSGGGRVDSVRIKSVPYIDSVFEYVSGTRVYIGKIYKKDGLQSGGEVRRITTNDYEITAAYYTIEGLDYSAVADTLTLNAYSDSAQFAAIYANTASIFQVRYGDKSSSPLPPVVNKSEEVLISLVLLMDTGRVIYTPSVDTNWIRNGNNLTSLFSGNLEINAQARAQGGFNVNPQFSNTVFSGIRGTVPNTFDVVTGNLTAGRFSLVGTGTGAYLDLFGAVNPSSGTGRSGILSLSSTFTPSGSSTKKPYSLRIAPTFNYTTHQSDTIFGLDYDPTITGGLNGTPHVGLRIAKGDVIFKALAEVSDTTYKPLGIDANGNVVKLSYWPGSGGGGSDDLAAVTARGATTSTPVQFDGGLTSTLFLTATDAQFTGTADFINAPSISNGSGLKFYRGAPSGSVDILQDNITGSRTHQLPDKDGTYAMTADIAQYFDDSSTVVIADSPIVVTLTETPGARDTVRITYAAPYKVYTALMIQSGTDAPTANVLENTIGSLTWARQNPGIYVATCTGCFTENKTTPISGVLILTTDGQVYNIKGYRNSDDEYIIETGNANDGIGDNFLANSMIEIRVYY
jgi:hypothetical protein